MKITLGHFGLGFSACTLAMSTLGFAVGCSGSDGPSTSTSSHWVTCVSDAECADVAGGAACAAGYCVDSAGARVEVKGASSSLGACDPFQAPVVSLELETILGAGEAADGTFYVADSIEGSDRMFVGTAEGLARVRVLGSGSESTSTGSITALTFLAPDDTVATFLIAVEGATTTLSLVAGSYRPGPEPPPDPEVLAVIDDATARATPVGGWVNPIVLEYHALVDGTDPLIVVRPELDWSYEDFRLFLGAGSEATERRVASVTRARDGGSTHVVFDLDGQTADAFFPFQGAPTLTVGGEEKPMPLVSSLPAMIPLPDSYLCLTGR